MPDVSAEITGADSAHTSVLTLTFRDGKVLTMRQDAIPTNLIGYALMHGLKQKLVDAAAISRNPDTGRSATVADKFNAVKVVYDRILGGSWNVGRGDGQPGGGLLFKALCRMYPAKTPEALRTYLAGKSKEEQAALRKNPKVAAIIEELRVETAKEVDVDSDAMLEELKD